MKIGDFGISKIIKEGEGDNSKNNAVPIRWTAVEIFKGGPFSTKVEINKEFFFIKKIFLFRVMSGVLELLFGKFFSQKKCHMLKLEMLIF